MSHLAIPTHHPSFLLEEERENGGGIACGIRPCKIAFLGNEDQWR